MAMSKVFKALRAGWRSIRVGGLLPTPVALRPGPFKLLKSSETPGKFCFCGLYLYVPY